jgi:mannose-6-phosphate isomerase
MDLIAQLTGTVKHYEWGGYSFIPSLLNLANEERIPFAEYWLGVHPLAECKLVMPDGSPRLLRDYFSTASPTAMGEWVARRFGTMPYLLKALDVRDMLSIQVHPSKTNVIKDFAEETELGVPLDSPQRNYKDNNHKPELMVAMGDFWLLHGFKPADQIKKTMEEVPELNFLLPIFNQSGYKGLYKTIMELPQEKVNVHLKPLINRIIPLYREGKINRAQTDYWAAKAMLRFSASGVIDRGIFSIYIFNLVRLQKGEAIFQDSGVPHAYLEGQNVEIMASSDNVLRGGLTLKPVNVPELLKHVVCEETHPQILRGENNDNELIYKTPAPDFELSSFKLNKGGTVTFTSQTAEVLLLVEGDIVITDKNNSITLKKGQPSALVLAGNEVRVTANDPSWFFKAGVPTNKTDK